jgi:hypothetical protein
MTALHAVLTADYVGSTDLDPAQRVSLADGLREAYGHLQARFPEALPHDLAVFAGDSWQVYVAEPGVALHVGLALRAWGRHALDLDTRLALAVDTTDFVVAENVAESDGAAFRRSGRGLKDLLSRDRLDLLAPSPLTFGPALEDDALASLALRSIENAFFALALVADRMARSWTQAQARAVYWALLDETLTTQEIGERWTPRPVRKQTVSEHLDRAGWQDLSDRVLHLYEKAVGNLLSLNHWAEHGNLGADASAGAPA